MVLAKRCAYCEEHQIELHHLIVSSGRQVWVSTQRNEDQRNPSITHPSSCMASGHAWLWMLVRNRLSFRRSLERQQGSKKGLGHAEPRKR